MTLQSEKENPQSIFKECREQGIESYHVSLNGANAAILSDKKSVGILRKSIVELTGILKTPYLDADPEYISRFGNPMRRVLIHCAAGIHRTGTVSYSLLRMDGRNHKEAYESLRVMRPVTYDGV